MAALAWPEGVKLAVSTWTTGVFKFAMAKSSADVTVSNGNKYIGQVLTGGDEFTDAGYSRQTVTTPTIPVSYSPMSIELHCDSPTFGTLSGGGTPAGYLLLYAFVTNDSDSPMIAAWPVLYVPDGTLEALFPEPTHGFVALSFNCPAGF